MGLVVGWLDLFRFCLRRLGLWALRLGQGRDTCRGRLFFREG